MKLTRRQEIFLLNMLDLYRELDGPFHYSLLAKRVGVSPFTAYDMLRLLEEKGYVKSEYRLDSEKPNAGRSEIYFSPTSFANQFIIELSDGLETENWNTLKIQLLTKIQDDRFIERALADEILARIPPNASEELQYCFEVIFILIFRLSKGENKQLLIKRFHDFYASKEQLTRSKLLLISGFILGLLANENSLYEDNDFPIIELVERYQVLVMEMEPRLCRRLGKEIRDMLLVLKH